jgi:hypothetical protein
MFMNDHYNTRLCLNQRYFRNGKWVRAHLDDIRAPAEVTHVDEVQLGPEGAEARVLEGCPPLVEGAYSLRSAGF